MPPKRRQVSFAVSPTPPPRSRISAKQRIEIKSGSWTDVPLAADSTDTTKLSPVPIPTNIHLDLQRAGIIPDPHSGTNERDVQWVHDCTWEFETEFFLTLPSLAGRKAELVFEGLDTFATVSLNGKVILESENMFLEHRVDITDAVLLMGKQNVLTIVFHSAMKRGDALMEEHGKRVCWNGHYNRPFVRKAQYHYGWDWGPSLVTCGPWKPIYIDIYSAQLSEVSVTPTLTADLKQATIGLRTKTDSATSHDDLEITATITSPNGTQRTVSLTSYSRNVYMSTITLDEPELWYPRTHGAQNLYEIEFKLCSGNTHLHTVTKKFGLRRVELVQDALPQVDGDNLSGGTTFYFRINNIPVFCGGSNWIPADSFQPRITRERLQALLDLMVRGNQSMVRVWGGGIYESDEFYEICDTAGILVWQDILMACADYPAHLKYFADSILKEVDQNLKRLRWHPSLVIVAGSNEDYQVADEEVGYDKDAPEDKWREEPFPSRWLYEKKFAEIVKRVCNGDEGELIGDAGEGGSGVVYWPGSPFGGEDSTDRTVGDVHQWNVWGGIQAPYQRYPDLGGRFVSEFGMPSFPSLPGIPYLLGSSSDNHPQSEAISHHTKAHSFEKRLYPYILENYRITNSSIAEIVYLSQLVQSDALSCAFRGWRHRWGTRECGGALVWQLNDVWPAISWSITSFPDIPKPAFYAISRAMRPITLISRRHTNDPKPNSKVEALCANKTAKAGKAAMHSTPHIYPPKQSTIDISLSSISHVPTEGLRVEVRYITISDSATTAVLSRDSVTVPGNNEVSLLASTVVPEDKPTVVFAVCYDAKGQVVARDVDWPQPMKFVDSPATLGPELQWWEGGVVISVARCIKGLVFEEFAGEIWDDNGVDVVPGEVLAIKVANLKKGPRKMWWYGCGKW
ncbi:beta-mannosidase [Tricharina praecox]|uniref:beta-mannosidase n=1 Tax=Tricharina praecox TaxID=43433 RepID=UPI0022203AF1|nr:beta-mannosidase [Tricharina praecox]KAI5850735.1 beta-mannosidase [Tricharina praecox]